MNGKVQFHGNLRSARKRRAQDMWDQEPEKALPNQLREWTGTQMLGVIFCMAFVLLSFVMGSPVRLESAVNTPAIILDAVQVRKDTVLTALAVLATLIVALALSTRSLAVSTHDAREETRRRERLRLSTWICGSLSVMFGLLYLAGFLAMSSSVPTDATDALIIVCLSQTLAYVASTFRLSVSEHLSAVQGRLPELLSKHLRATEVSFRRWYFTPRDSVRVPKLVLSLASAVLLLIGFVMAMLTTPRNVLDADQARYVEIVVLLWVMLLMLLLIACAVGVQWLLPQNRSRLAAVVMLVPLGASIAFLAILTVMMLASDEYAGTEKTSAMIIAVLAASSLCSCLLVLPLALTRYPRSPKLRSAYVRLCYPAHILRYSVLANARAIRRQEIRNGQRRMQALESLALPEQCNDHRTAKIGANPQ
ncbi:hypothetical protein [Glutamicibacter halophytocola]|uniref:hypothetical protein n=1 Tax=Glutamicibacter halophytocola TaxID=1933880 RepID=UPI0018928EB9|nr:hypothetical protein [Glutamicibacter halophytocola]